MLAGLAARCDHPLSRPSRGIGPEIRRGTTGTGQHGLDALKLLRSSAPHRYLRAPPLPQGKDKRGDELPQELQRWQDRIEAIRKARAELEAEAAADQARQRQQQAQAAEQQVAEAETTQADAKTREKAARRAKPHVSAPRRLGSWRP